MSALAYLEQNIDKLTDEYILKSIDDLKKQQLKRANEEKKRLEKTNIALGRPVENLF